MSEPRLTGVTVHDEHAAWQAAGFTVTAAGIAVGDVVIRLAGRDEHPRGGLRAWSFAGLPEATTAIDGIATGRDSAAVAADHRPHPNGVIALDHLVVLTPDCDRTVAAFRDVGLAPRRVRHTDQYGPPFRQTFFRAGPVILELIGPDEPTAGDQRPARLYGLAFTVADLDATAATLGDAVGRVKDAVQVGRRITTLRHEPLGISCALAFMSPGTGAVE